MKDFEYMVECMERDLIVMLMEKQGMTMTEAFDTFYNSETHEKLNDARSGLYFQSPGYVYSFLNNEIHHLDILKDGVVYKQLHHINTLLDMMNCFENNHRSTQIV